MRYPIALALLLLSACVTAIESDEPELLLPYDDETPEQPAHAPDAATDADADADGGSTEADAGYDAAFHDAETSDARRDGGRGPEGPGPTEAGVVADASQPPEDACSPIAFYRDQDGDRFGDPKTALTLTDCHQTPSGYTPIPGDCYDMNADAHPGQPLWFRGHRGDGSYDYDCDGEAALRFPKLAECPVLDDACPPAGYWHEGFSCDFAGMYDRSGAAELREGWSLSNPEVPGCGQNGGWGINLRYDTSLQKWMCNIPLFRPSDLRPQQCR